MCTIYYVLKRGSHWMPVDWFLACQPAEDHAMISAAACNEIGHG